MDDISAAGSSTRRFKRKRRHTDSDIDNGLVAGAPSSHALDLSSVTNGRGTSRLNSSAAVLPLPAPVVLDPTILSEEAWTPWNQDAVDAPAEQMAGVNVVASESLNEDDSVCRSFRCVVVSC
jgi:hypothetical protein